MNVWSKVLPLTTSCLSPLSYSNPTGPCENVASELGSGGGFNRFPLDISYNWLVRIYPQYGRKSYEKNKIPNSKIHISSKRCFSKKDHQNIEDFLAAAGV